MNKETFVIAGASLTGAKAADGRVVLVGAEPERPDERPPLTRRTPTADQELQSGAFLALWLKEGRVIVGMNVNVWDANEHMPTLIRTARPIAVDRLTDPYFPLDALAAESARTG